MRCFFSFDWYGRMPHSVIMSKEQIRIVVIDPDTFMVWEQVEVLTLERMYELIGCRTVEAFPWRGQTVWCDEEGLYRAPDEDGNVPQTWLHGATQPLVGTLLVTGMPDGEGETQSASATVARVENWIARMATEPLTFEPDVQVISL